MKKTPITSELLSQWSADYASDMPRQVATLALSKTDINDVMFSNQGAWRMRHHFSVEIPTLPVTNQQHSGRCWLFAATNVLRERIAKELNLEQFELSQAYLAFWDKFERSNYFLEAMLETASLPADDRTVQFILTTGVHDGGQWGMFVNIVKKYGVVPKEVFDDGFQACNTRNMNAWLNRALKIGAIKLRRMANEGQDAAAISAEKNALLGKVYSYLCACYGEPPKTFDFAYTDKDGVSHFERDYTPASFTQRYVGDMLDNVVSIINAPTQDKPYNKTFTIAQLGNVVGMPNVTHLNLTMADFKAAIIRQLQAGKVVWFGSDVGKWGAREDCIWDDQCFGAELFTGLDMAISKEDSLDYSYAAMNHAMVITGVNLVDGKPDRWKIENSWGEKKPAKGYYICSDTWFDELVFQAAVEKEYLGELASLAEMEPVVLDPWDPMGTLAD